VKILFPGLRRLVDPGLNSGVPCIAPACQNSCERQERLVGRLTEAFFPDFCETLTDKHVQMIVITSEGLLWSVLRNPI
jgi:hypothetical protein